MESDPKGQMILNWYFSFSSFQCAVPNNGGACTDSGPFLPTLTEQRARTAGIFHDPHLEPGGRHHADFRRVQLGFVRWLTRGELAAVGDLAAPLTASVGA